MNADLDLMIDRRRLRRKLTFWRVITVVVGLGLVAALAGYLRAGTTMGQGPQVARVNITGMIRGSQETLDLLKSLETAPVQAVILRIDSGGGTTLGSEVLYQRVRALAEKKPVVAVIDTVGASGAYMTALGADRIYAQGTSLVGSIGVIAQIPNASRLLDMVGVKVDTVRSTPLKANPSGLEPTSKEAMAALEDTVLDTYRWFKQLVGERRKLEGGGLDKVADGRVFTGRQALGLKLIDALGGEDEALAWLRKEKGVAKDSVIVPFKPGKPNRLAWLGAELRETARHALFGAGALDGLVSLWHGGE